ncbi:MAG: hypothetical protein SGPRY_007145 [Prymnesium sp.]
MCVAHGMLSILYVGFMHVHVKLPDGAFSLPGMDLEQLPDNRPLTRPPHSTCRPAKETAKESDNKEEVEEIDLTTSDEDEDDKGDVLAQKKAPQKRTSISAWSKHCQKHSKLCAD